MVETEGKSQKELDLKLILVYLWLAHTPHDSRIKSWFNSSDHGSLHMTRIDFKELNRGLILLTRVIAHDKNRLQGIKSWFNSSDHGSLHMTRIYFKELNIGLILACLWIGLQLAGLPLEFKNSLVKVFWHKLGCPRSLRAFPIFLSGGLEQFHNVSVASKCRSIDTHTTTSWPQQDSSMHGGGARSLV